MSSGRLGPGYIDVPEGAAPSAPALPPGGWTDLLVEGVTTDSRRVGKGQLFVPLTGDSFDGHDYVEAAFRQGAAAAFWSLDRELPAALAGKPLVLVEEPLEALQSLAAAYRSELRALIVGITGSNGKTTTKDMAAAALGSVMRVHKTAGNLNNHIGLPLTVLELPEDAEAAVLEMGMSGLREIALLTSIARPDIAIITNIGDAHLLQLGSREMITRAKLEIVEGLRPGGLLLVSADEPLIAAELGRMTLPAGAQVRTFGASPRSDWRAAGIEVGAQSCAFTVKAGPAAGFRLAAAPAKSPAAAAAPASVPAEASVSSSELHSAAAPAEAACESCFPQVRIEIPVPGVHNVHNALAAIAAATAVGVPAEAVASGLRSMQLTGMRIQPVAAACGAMILNDAYNANPTAVRAAVDLVAGLTGYRRKWIVLSDMRELGETEEELHRETGAYITPDKADAVLTCGELSAFTSAGAAEAFGGLAPGAVRHFDSQESLIHAIREELDPRDLVLVKGSRTMHMERVVEALQR
ncbi:UDP-N-acetylmuramoyl-tripeptide--D-alanyl-D-alanine ligase [Paenibacillus albicereus]|uniref:UDP-N-acetylmuramoyl-tripeptide--D-alanyl-D-alanine ligase n=2 Tax=Paenibacillus albicereus TaxID=2726185 RepID=A0A6H2H3X2_9BACL|nr:UDP-N-acetylmuramoyl-tripeptide--D-alanyl-D-alanine ligase [Paenibacillus albicereus]